MCIANDFTKYDVHAVNQMQKNIKLIKYKKFDNNLILFEHLNAPNVKPMVEVATQAIINEQNSTIKLLFSNLQIPN